MTTKTKLPYRVLVGDTVDSSHRWWKRALDRYTELDKNGRPSGGQVTIKQGDRVIVAGW